MSAIIGGLLELYREGGSRQLHGTLKRIFQVQKSVKKSQITGDLPSTTKHVWTGPNEGSSFVTNSHAAVEVVASIATYTVGL